MTSPACIPTYIRTQASLYRCANCPPERVCAWGCVQGAGVEEIVIGATLALEGVDQLNVAANFACQALAECYESPLRVRGAV